MSDRSEVLLSASNTEIRDERDIDWPPLTLNNDGVRIRKESQDVKADNLQRWISSTLGLGESAWS